jgi:hypothetical protein
MDVVKAAEEVLNEIAASAFDQEDAGEGRYGFAEEREQSSIVSFVGGGW